MARTDDSYEQAIAAQRAAGLQAATEGSKVDLSRLSGGSAVTPLAQRVASRGFTDSMAGVYGPSPPMQYPGLAQRGTSPERRLTDSMAGVYGPSPPMQYPALSFADISGVAPPSPAAPRERGGPSEHVPAFGSNPVMAAPRERGGLTGSMAGVYGASPPMQYPALSLSDLDGPNPLADGGFADFMKLAYGLRLPDGYVEQLGTRTQQIGNNLASGYNRGGVFGALGAGIREFGSGFGTAAKLAGEYAGHVGDSAVQAAETLGAGLSGDYARPPSQPREGSPGEFIPAAGGGNPLAAPTKPPPASKAQPAPTPDTPQAGGLHTMPTPQEMQDQYLAGLPYYQGRGAHGEPRFAASGTQGTPGGLGSMNPVQAQLAEELKRMGLDRYRQAQLSNSQQTVYGFGNAGPSTETIDMSDRGKLLRQLQTQASMTGNPFERIMAQRAYNEELTKPQVDPYRAALMALGGATPKEQAEVDKTRAGIGNDQLTAAAQAYRDSSQGDYYKGYGNYYAGKNASTDRQARATLLGHSMNSIPNMDPAVQAAVYDWVQRAYDASLAGSRTGGGIAAPTPEMVAEFRKQLGLK